MRKNSRIPSEIGSYDAKTRLPELLREVQKGKAYTITNRGRPVAELVPVGSKAHANAARAIEDMKTFMHAQHVRGVNIQALVEEGRR